MATQTPANNISASDLELLSAYIDNQLSVAERATLERRLEREAALRSELTELRATSELLGELPQLAAPRSFALDPAHAPKRGWAFPWHLSLQLGGGLAGLALVALLSLQFLFTSGTSITMAPAAPVSQATMEAAIAMAPAATAAPAAPAGGAAMSAAPAATEAPAAAMQAAPAPTAAPAAESAAYATAAPESTIDPAAMAVPAPAPPESAATAREAAPTSDEAAASGPAESTAQDTLGLEAAPTEVIASTDSSSPDTTQLDPADPAANQAAAKEPEAGQNSWLGLLIGGGLGLLVLAAIVALLVRGRGV